ncbi:hypothetical protein BKA65DRAFT_486971 [Rhexocercosporidium sp. MPI-PUGE-AT-0058]|nr:hypothetical protein BKA65DRAFT_486971 [Rhexocercosporidium sp. MPI-PUGE-AT-0058]
MRELIPQNKLRAIDAWMLLVLIIHLSRPKLILLAVERINIFLSEESSTSAVILVLKVLLVVRHGDSLCGFLDQCK